VGGRIVSCRSLRNARRSGVDD
jgi:subtilase family serine protease